MRYVRIFLLNLQYVMAHRARPLIYVFTYLISTLIFFGFMKGIFEGRDMIHGWSLDGITIYYFLLIPMAGILLSHPEFPIVRDDIEKGELAGRLLKPFSYYWQRFYIEIPVRLFQGVIGIILFFILSYYFKLNFNLLIEINKLLPLLIIFVLAYFICFTLKMILAIIALWTTDIRGLREMLDTVIYIFAGYVLPITLLPDLLKEIADKSPFPYMIYYPVVAMQGKLTVFQMWDIVYAQLFWIILLGLIFKFQWKKGLMRFADLGH